ncbi:MAG: preprotein translocase subunit SecG [Rhodospirillaceae bacterium]|nr:preprotein translocase subunit SecG [Rhodospirillaceae bacterium]
MITVILVIHLILAITLVGTVLLQRSEGGGLGMGSGGGGGMGGFMTGRDTANLLTRTTAILATGFFITSITLAVMAGGDRKPASIMDQPVSEAPAVPEQPKAPQAQ